MSERRRQGEAEPGRERRPASRRAAARGRSRPGCWPVPAGTGTAPRGRHRLASSSQRRRSTNSLAEIAEMRDRPAERGQAELQEGQEDLAEISLWFSIVGLHADWISGTQVRCIALVLQFSSLSRHRISTDVTQSPPTDRTPVARILGTKQLHLCLGPVSHKIGTVGDCGFERTLGIGNQVYISNSIR